MQYEVIAVEADGSSVEAPVGSGLFLDWTPELGPVVTSRWWLDWIETGAPELLEVSR
jgi:hypothetical protein